MRTGKTFLYSLAGVAVVAVVLYVAADWPTLTREPVGPPAGPLPDVVGGGLTLIEGQFLGYTEQSITGRFGPPSRKWDGHYGNPDWEFPRRYSDAVSAAYERPDGTLYLSYCRQAGEWVCFRSTWLPAGWEF